MITNKLMNEDYEAVAQEYYEWGWDSAIYGSAANYHVNVEEFQEFYNAGYEDALESIR